MESANHTIEVVKEYYGRYLQTKKDLQTSACCTAEALPPYLLGILQQIHPEVLDKFYGCGSPLPLELTGKTILDLGCGTGRDCFILSKLVGPHGQVLGIDMTQEQIALAQKHLSYHMDKFHYSKPNLQFIQGYIEDLRSSGIQSGSIDAVISNCVINLSPKKELVFSEIFRVLKPGGELYFSDVFSDRRLSGELSTDAQLIGECLGGALYMEDFRRLMAQSGCNDFRMISKRKLTLNHPEIEKKCGKIGFYSMTLRAFKLDLEDRCEDYGQVAYYLGTLTESPHFFYLDDHHTFEVGKPVPVCSNTAEMLTKTRYAQHFKVIGDLTQHFGLFDCGPTQMGSCC